MHPLDFFQQANADYLEGLHQDYLRDPDSVDPQWAIFFAGFEAGSAETPEHCLSDGQATEVTRQLATGVQDLVHSYRELGHFLARLDPLGSQRSSHPLLDLEQFGLSAADLDRHVGAEDGYDLLRELRDGECGIRIALFTGSVEISSADRRIADAVLAKHFAIEELLSTVPGLAEVRSS